YVTDADLVIGAVLVPGAAAPKLVTRAMLQRMRKGSVLVDISIDQGGCFETSRPTTHADPPYLLNAIVHYSPANMPAPPTPPPPTSHPKTPPSRSAWPPA